MDVTSSEPDMPLPASVSTFSAVETMTPADFDKQRLMELAGLVMTQAIEEAKLQPADSPLVLALKQSGGSLDRFMEAMQQNPAAIPPTLGAALNSFADHSEKVRKQDEAWWNEFVKRANISYLEAERQEAREEKSIQASHLAQASMSDYYDMMMRDTDRYLANLYQSPKLEKISKDDWMNMSKDEIHQKYDQAFSGLDDASQVLAKGQSAWLVAHSENPKMMMAISYKPEELTPERIKQLGLNAEELKSVQGYHALVQEREALSTRVDLLGLSRLMLAESERASDPEEQARLKKQANQLFNLANDKERQDSPEMIKEAARITGSKPEDVFKPLTEGKLDDESLAVWGNKEQMERYKRLQALHAQADRESDQFEKAAGYLREAQTASSPEEKERLQALYVKANMEARKGKIEEKLGRALEQPEEAVLHKVEEQAGMSFDPSKVGKVLSTTPQMSTAPRNTINLASLSGSGMLQPEMSEAPQASTPQTATASPAPETPEPPARSSMNLAGLDAATPAAIDKPEHTAEPTPLMAEARRIQQNNINRASI